MKILQVSLATLIARSARGTPTSNANVTTQQQDPALAAADAINTQDKAVKTLSATEPINEAEGRDLKTSTATALAAWHPNYMAGWTLGHCTYSVDANTPGFTSQLACCKGAYAGQTSGTCLSKLPSPPTGSPTDSGGYSDVWYPDYKTSFAGAHCIDDGPIPAGVPTYSTMFACCKSAYAGQFSGKCLSMLPTPPTTEPTGAGGPDAWYPDYTTNNYSNGACINERPLPNGRVTYDSQLACCKGSYGDQDSGKCLSMLPKPPTSSPTDFGGLDIYYPDFTKPYSAGTCINDGPEPPNGVVTYDSQEMCCASIYPGQASLSCVCSLANPPEACYVLELEAAQCLYQRDFDRGTKVINRPGGYKVCENIEFAPGKPSVSASDEDIANAFDPLTVGGPQYDKNEFSLGYFAAIAVAADDVTILLNGHTISQDPIHALMQRFFAVIELASSPFIDAVGPADFVSDQFVPAKNFKLKGPGTIGLSSHHGIHGNNNENVVITGVVFNNFEVAAVSLNNVKGLVIENCIIPQNRMDVPVLGSFSAARQMLPFVKNLKELAQPYAIQMRNVTTTSESVYDALVASIANVYRDVLSTGFIHPSSHPDDHKLYHNVHKVVDGPCYAFLVHGKGPAVGGQGFELSTDSATISSNVKILSNRIEKIKCWTNEIPSAVIDNVVQNDARGGMLQLVDTTTNEWLASDGNGRYTGNVVADAQILVASAIHDGVLAPGDNILQTSANTIAPEIVTWASGSTLFQPSFRCNGDSMHHVVKGSILVRVEDTQGFNIDGNTMGSAVVLSGPPAASQEYFDLFPGTDMWTCTDYHKGASIEDGTEQQLANLRGISVAAVSHFLLSKESTISGNRLTNFKSQYANSIVGIDIQGKSQGVLVADNFVNLKSGTRAAPNDQYIACRVRKYVSQDDIVKRNNVFHQEEFFEEVAGRNLRWRKIPDNHPISVLTEWDLGGCPYGRA